MKSFICASRLSFYESFNSIYSNFARLIHSIPALMLLIGIPFCSTAVAQTAHFSGAVSTVGSGFSCPVGAAVNGSGNIFVVDPCLNAVKEIVAGTGGAASGTVNSSSTVIPVGSGFATPSGVAVDSSGNVFVADRGHNAVYEIVAGTGGAASGTVNASSTVNPVGNVFSNPDGVAVDGSGNVFVADSGNNVVKVIVAVGGVVSSTSAVYPVGSGFSWPFGVAVDRSGNVFVADIHNNALYEIVAGTPTVNVVGIGYSDPQGVAVDGSGNVFVADTMNNAVKEIVAGTGGAASGTVYWGSTVNVMGSGFSYPAGVAVNGSGNVFVADSGSSVVKEIQTGTANYGSVAVATTAPPTITLTFYFDTGGTIAAPAVLTQGAANKDFTDAGTGTCTTNGTSHAYSAGDTCTVVVTFTPTRPGQRLGAAQLIGSGGGVIATGNIYGIGIGPMVTFPSNTTVSTLGSGLIEPSGVAVDGSGNVYIADAMVNSVVEVPWTGNGYGAQLTPGWTPRRRGGRRRQRLHCRYRQQPRTEVAVECRQLRYADHNCQRAR
jgi:sugar lactone lactonase YvrE